MANSDLFAMYIHHGGNLVEMGDMRVYAGGNFVGRFDNDVDKFGYLDIEEEIEQLGYVSWKRIVYKVPRAEVYKDLKDDTNVMQMLSHLSDRCRVLNVYVDGGKKTGEDNVDDMEDKSNGGEKTGEDNVDDMKDKSDSGEENHLSDSNGGEVNDGLQSDVGDVNDFSDSSLEDLEYMPADDEEVTDDDISEVELCSEDDEYVEARRNRRNVRDNSDISILDDLLVGGAVGEGAFSDYENFDEDVYSSSTDDEGDRFRQKIKRIVYDPKCDHKHLRVTIGMKFEDGYQAREALTTNAIENGWQIHFRRVSKHQMEAKCTLPCKWRCYGSLVKTKGCFVIKTVDGVHTCPRAMRNKLVTSSWIAKRYLNVFRIRPEITVKELGKDILERYISHTTIWKLYKARDKAIKQLRGSVEEHYAKIRSYILELLRVDKEGRFELKLDVGAIFKGIYIGFSALRKGFNVGCRRLIGLDGAFLKTYLGGVLLCAVGKDGNNQLFPIAWAVVEVENEACWRWFLQILMEELGLGDGLGITFISYQQKGLINAIQDLAPFATHRNCARHVYCNWKKTHKGGTLRNIFWKAVKSTYLEEYNLALQEMEKENAAAHEDFLGRDPKKFCKAFFEPSVVCDMNLNNVSETFNNYIVNARGKHLIHMLEEIRTSLMERQFRKLEEIRGNDDLMCPYIKQKLDKLNVVSRFCITHPALGGKFEVELHEDQFVVDVGARSCTCREWDLTGIPCPHGCAVINFLKEDVFGYVHEYYSLAKYRQAYAYALTPLNGEKMWPRAEGYPVKPPLVKKMPGRPKKKRKRDSLETNPSNRNKLKKECKMTCQRCFQQGHNSRGCKNAPVQKPIAAQGKRGRPRKVQAPEGSLSNAQKAKASTSSSRPPTDKVVLRQERRKASEGCGVLFCDTGNIYMRIGSTSSPTFSPTFVNPPTPRRRSLRKCASSSSTDMPT